MVSAQLGGVSLRVASWWADPEIYSTVKGQTPSCWAPGLGTPGAVQNTFQAYTQIVGAPNDFHWTTLSVVDYGGSGGTGTRGACFGSVVDQLGSGRGYRCQRGAYGCQMAGSGH